VLVVLREQVLELLELLNIAFEASSVLQFSLSCVDLVENWLQRVPQISAMVLLNVFLSTFFKVEADALSKFRCNHFLFFQ